jgi:hypothetical protein
MQIVVSGMVCVYHICMSYINLQLLYNVVHFSNIMEWVEMFTFLYASFLNF